MRCIAISPRRRREEETGRREPPRLEKAELIPPRPCGGFASVALLIAFPFVTVALQRLGARIPQLSSGLAPWKHIIVATFRYAPYYFLGFFVLRIVRDDLHQLSTRFEPNTAILLVGQD